MTYNKDTVPKIRAAVLGAVLGIVFMLISAVCCGIGTALLEAIK